MASKKETLLTKAKNLKIISEKWWVVLKKMIRLRLQNTVNAVVRFPATSLFCVLLSILTIVIVELNESGNEPSGDWIAKLYYIFVLGAVLFIPIAQIAEHFSNKWYRISLHVLGIIFLFVYYLQIQKDNLWLELYRGGFIFFSIVALMPVCSLKKDSTQEDILLHCGAIIHNFFASILLSMLLCLGVLSLFFFLNLLLGIDASGLFKTRPVIYSVIFFFWCYIPLMFLSYFPILDFKFKPNRTYAIGDKFIKSILTPFTTGYFIIIYLYFGKIILIWDWPEGVVSYLVVIFSALGMILQIAIFKYKKIPFFKLLYHSIYYLILPLVLLLGMAIWVRVKEYGITENRYIIIALGVWIFLFSIFHIVFKYKKTQWMFISISLLSFILTIGPWSIFSVSKHSQFNRLVRELKYLGVLQGDNINPYQGPAANLQEAKEIIDYLEERSYWDELKITTKYGVLTKELILEKLNLDEASKSK